MSVPQTPLGLQVTPALYHPARLDYLSCHKLNYSPRTNSVWLSSILDGGGGGGAFISLWLYEEYFSVLIPRESPIQGDRNGDECSGKLYEASGATQRKG